MVDASFTIRGTHNRRCRSLAKRQAEHVTSCSLMATTARAVHSLTLSICRSSPSPMPVCSSTILALVRVRQYEERSGRESSKLSNGASTMGSRRKTHASAACAHLHLIASEIGDGRWPVIGRTPQVTSYCIYAIQLSHTSGCREACVHASDRIQTSLALGLPRPHVTPRHNAHIGV